MSDPYKAEAAIQVLNGKTVYGYVTQAIKNVVTLLKGDPSQLGLHKWGQRPEGRHYK